MQGSRRMQQRLCPFALLLSFTVFLLAGCAAPGRLPGTAGDAGVSPAKQIAATAHPLATRAALEMLDLGGAPIDAAIAAQMVLGLVEPQSSGIGGGALLLVWDAGARKLASFDGLAAAPAHTTPGLTVDTDGKRLQALDVQRGGRSVGVPGTLAVLQQVHQRYGRLPWASLFAPAVRLAEAGFPLAPYMHAILSQPGAAAQHGEFQALFFDAQGRLLPAGTSIRNPAYAQTLRRIAAQGHQGHLLEGGAARIVAALQRGFRPSLITEQDLLAYRAQERVATCGPYLVYTVCVAPPPSFGGIAVLQILQMIEARSGGRFDFDDPAFVHLYAEAGKLAQADRRKYLGDPDFVPVPTAALLEPGYVRSRARAIDASRANAKPAAGEVNDKRSAYRADDAATASMTSQLAVVDREGNALAMTTTNNLNFGSRLLVDGFVLNNAMTNFSAPPRPGEVVANRMQPGKRPVTSMAPTIVFDHAGVPVLVGGSAGGGQIVDYVAQSMIEMLANGLSPAEGLRRGHVSTALPGKVQLEQGSAAEKLAAGLREKGHTVSVERMPSGLAFVARRGTGWIGAADPRRDGSAEGR